MRGDKRVGGERRKRKKRFETRVERIVTNNKDKGVKEKVFSLCM